LAALYQCSLVFCGVGESQVLFTRHDDLQTANFRYRRYGTG
jgi:hypothetical protein